MVVLIGKSEPVMMGAEMIITIVSLCWKLYPEVMIWV